MQNPALQEGISLGVASYRKGCNAAWGMVSSKPQLPIIMRVVGDLG